MNAEIIEAPLERDESATLKRIFPPWMERSGLISWLDMNEFSAYRYVNIGASLKSLESTFGESDLDQEGAKQFLIVVSRHLSEIGLNDAAILAQRLSGQIEREKPESARVKFSLFKEMVTIGMQSQIFLWLEKDQGEWHADPIRKVKSLVGEAAFDAFPAAMNELEESGRCYALERYTACVFHLMRSLEPSLDLIANEMGLTGPFNSWNHYLDQIGSEVRSQFPKSADADRIFYEGAMSHLRSIKDAWRNPTMHSIAVRYDEKGATDLMQYIGALMRYLGTRLQEPHP